MKTRLILGLNIDRLEYLIRGVFSLYNFKQRSQRRQESISILVHKEGYYVDRGFQSFLTEKIKYDIIRIK